MIAKTKQKILSQIKIIAINKYYRDISKKSIFFRRYRYDTIYRYRTRYIDNSIYRLITIYGVRGIVHKWFKSYLSGRHQFTYVNEVCSTITDITCGVPQGSVLGPLLFLLYINDINNVVPSGIVKLFADDTNVFIHGRDSTVVAKDANYFLQRLNEWFIANKLSLSLGKTSYTIFWAAFGDEIVFKIGTTKINRLTSCKYL